MTDELRDLKWAIVVSQHRSLRRAAEALNIRQSTLSRRLRDLEYRRGSQLFERTNGGTRPTRAGQDFLAGARRILEEVDHVFSRAKAQSRGEGGLLTLGIYTSLAAGNLRATLIEYGERFPGVDLRTIDGGRNDLLSDLAAGVIDVVVMIAPASGAIDWNDCALRLWSERVVVALPERHALCAQPVVRWSELKEERIIIPTSGPAVEFEQLLATKLGNSNLARAQRQTTGLDRLLSLVGTGRGPLLVLEGATGARYDGVVYREVQDESGPTRFDFRANWRKENSNPTLKPFLDILRTRHPDFSVSADHG